MYYQIKESLSPCRLEDCKDRSYPYVANISLEDFQANQALFDMGMDAELKIIEVTHVRTNYDSMTGCISIPDRQDPDKPNRTFGFALDERGIVYLKDDGIVQSYLDKIMRENHWRHPSLENFFYDFLEQIIESDLDVLQKYDQQMDDYEEDILQDHAENVLEGLNRIRKVMISLSRHYERLIDLSDKLQANENGFFREEGLRFFQLYSERCSRLLQYVASLKEHTVQVRDLYRTRIDEKQNNNMAVLTVIATIFTPITILTGWYGMNFVHMPELDDPMAYPILLCVCLTIIIVSLIIFKKKRWI